MGRWLLRARVALWEARAEGVARWFRVLFRERGILSFFHAGKMTTYRVKIPRFRCGYFRL